MTITYFEAIRWNHIVNQLLNANVDGTVVLKFATVFKLNNLVKILTEHVNHINTTRDEILKKNNVDISVRIDEENENVKKAITEVDEVFNMEIPNLDISKIFFNIQEFENLSGADAQNVISLFHKIIKE